MRILLADDDLTSRFVVQMTLEDLGHKCQTVVDGDDAWVVFQACDPDVVISDSVMPGLTGSQFCRNIRATESGRYTYFIMLSGRRDPADIDEAMKAGVDAYLIKPLDPDDLRAQLLAADRVTDLHSQRTRILEVLEELDHQFPANDQRRPVTGLYVGQAIAEDLEIFQSGATPSMTIATSDGRGHSSAPIDAGY
jgi:sigma-B regulation protein RsbU (phosphoserine phosphatase)